MIAEFLGLRGRHLGCHWWCRLRMWQGGVREDVAEGVVWDVSAGV